MTSPGTSSAATAAEFRDWSELPEDLLLTAMSAMQLPDLVHSGAVCRSWRSAFADFRRLRLPSPPHPPYLLYASGDGDTGDVSLYSPATGAHFRVPLLTGDPEAAAGVVGSAHGWVFTTDRHANPYLLNPLTGERAALPPVTTLSRVRGRRFLFHAPRDGGGGRGVAYDVDLGSRMTGVVVRPVMARTARRWMFRRVAMSASPSAAGGCVVLLLHMPHGELSFARPGIDERWTPIDGGSDSDRDGGGYYLDAVHNPNDGLFYALHETYLDATELHSVDLFGAIAGSPSSPVVAAASTVMYTELTFPGNNRIKNLTSRYLAVTPRGDLIVAERRRWISLLTMGIRLFRLDLRRREQVNDLVGGVGDGLALFLGNAAAVCVRVEEDCGRAIMFRGNCAYLTDDYIDDDQMMMQPTLDHKRRWGRVELGVWEFESNFAGGSLTKLRDTWPLHPSLRDDSPVPIWFTPSLN